VHPGQRLGKYVLGERIAIGGMAEVWAARVEGPQGFVKPLALKFMLESFSGDPELERLFVNEARVAAQLQHANIVSIFDFDKLGPQEGGGLAGRYYIAMERIEGRDLRQIAQAIQNGGRTFPRPLALHVAGEVLKGLRYVHERREGRRPLGLIHRDVSPHNVLVSYAGEVKLSDFGIAKARASSTSGKGTGSIRGKLSYAAPEQLDDAALDHRTDQIAFGVTFWELLAGRKLFDGRDELEVMTQVGRCEIPPLSSLPAARDIDPAIDAVVRRMLARDVRDRFPTTGEALSAVLALPGYTADSAPLGNMVRTLFGTQTDFPVTGPVLSPLPAAPPADPLPRTMTMQPASRAPAGAGGTPGRPSGPRAAEPRTRTRSGTPTPRGGRRPSGQHRADAFEVSAGSPLRRRVALVAVGLGLMAVVVTALAIWRSLAPPGDGEQTTSGRPLAPRPQAARPSARPAAVVQTQPPVIPPAALDPEPGLIIVSPAAGASPASPRAPAAMASGGGASAGLFAHPSSPVPLAPAPPVPSALTPPAFSVPPVTVSPAPPALDAGTVPGAPNEAPIIE
jgi:serine/threonine protein kinase